MGPSKGVMSLPVYTCISLINFLSILNSLKLKHVPIKQVFFLKRTNNNAVYVIFFIQITMYRHSLHVYINLILFKVKQKISFE